MRQYLQISRPVVLLLVATVGAFSQTSILQIRVVEGEGAVHAPGSRSPRAITVEVTDDAGRPVSGAAVSFHLPEDGPGGTFFNGLRTDVIVTDPHGRAAARGFLANRLPGRFQVRVLASREQARAGTVSFQYIGVGSAVPSGSNRKWIAIAAAAAGGVVAGAFALHGSSGTAAAQTPATPPPAVVTTIGPPSISVGKP